LFNQEGISMQFRAIALTTLSAALLAASTACAPPETDSASEPADISETEMEAETPADAPAAEDAEDMDLQTYDGAPFNYPISAQYPDTMEVEDGCAGEGCGFFFTFKPQGNALDTAEVHIFLPAGAATAAEQEPFVTGPNGLIENAGWIVDSMDSGATDQFPYPWVEKVINFSSDQEESGHVLLGEAEGQAVQVLLLYPAEMADEYWPAANTVLETLEFNPDLLPLNVSSEGPAEGEDPATMCDPAQEAC
jgi:hypothetical protein